MDPMLKRKEIMEIKRILVSRTDKIGDLILSIPSFFMLKKMLNLLNLMLKRIIQIVSLY